MKKKKSIVFLLCYLGYVSIYIARINLSVAAPYLKESNVLSSAQIGLLGSAFSVAYALGRLINGTISDRVRPAVMIFIGMVVAGISNLAFSITSLFEALFLFWVLNAVGQSMLWSSLLCVMGQLYDAETVKKMNSYLVTSVATGNIAAILVSSGVLRVCSVAWAFRIPGLLTVLMGFLCLAVLVRLPNARPEPKKQRKQESLIPVHLLKSRDLRYALVPTLFHGVIKDNVTLWMTLIVVDRYQVALDRSALFVLMIPAIGFAGRMIYPACYQLCGKREHFVSIGAFAVCTVSASLLLFPAIGVVPSVIALGVLYAASSMINTSMVSVYPTRYAKQGRLASVSGLMDFLTYLGAGIGSAVYGKMVDSFGYQPMFLSWILLSVVSVAVLIIMQKQESKRSAL